jgi:hypothetical protein
MRLAKDFGDKRRAFDTSWFPELGEKLVIVKSSKMYRDWRGRKGRKFKSFTQYCLHELNLSSTVGSDIAAAYEYLKANHPELLGCKPSVRRKKVPGYNEINILRRARPHLPVNKFQEIDALLFQQMAGREQLKAALRTAVPKRERRSDIDDLRKEIAVLRRRVAELEQELAHRSLCGLETPFSKKELRQLRRGVSMYVHPDIGGDNDLMRDLNALFDVLTEV